jgi:serine/threonine-protein kinase RsbW
MTGNPGDASSRKGGKVLTMMASKGPKAVAIRLRFRSDESRIPAAVDQVMRFVRMSGCELGQEIEVELALREALNNAVVHGNGRDPDKWVSVRCGCDPDDGVSIVVRDEGRGFEPDLVPRGVGLLVMRSYMDEVAFEKGGTEVHLRKSPALPRTLRASHLHGVVQAAPHALHP